MQNGSLKGMDFLDLNGMGLKVRSWLEELKTMGARSEEIREVERLLDDGRIGEAYTRAGSLKTILEELKPDALSRKLLDISRRGERVIFDILELSRDLSDIELWRQYRAGGYDGFPDFCQNLLKIAPRKARAIAGLKEIFAVAPGELGPGEILSMLLSMARALAKSVSESESEKER